MTTWLAIEHEAVTLIITTNVIGIISTVRVAVRFVRGIETRAAVVAVTFGIVQVIVDAARLKLVEVVVVVVGVLELAHLLELVVVAVARSGVGVLAVALAPSPVAFQSGVGARTRVQVALLLRAPVAPTVPRLLFLLRARAARLVAIIL